VVPEKGPYNGCGGGGMDVPDIRFQFAGMSGIGFRCPVLARLWIWQKSRKLPII